MNKSLKDISWNVTEEEYRKDKYTPVLFHDPDNVPEIGFRVIYEN